MKMLAMGILKMLLPLGMMAKPIAFAVMGRPTMPMPIATLPEALGRDTDALVVSRAVEVEAQGLLNATHSIEDNHGKPTLSWSWSRSRSRAFAGVDVDVVVGADVIVIGRRRRRSLDVSVSANGNANANANACAWALARPGPPL